MSSTKRISQFFSSAIVKHLLFWLGVFAYFIGTVNMANHEGYLEVIDHFSIYVLSQMVVAYVTLFFLIPRFLTPKKNVWFVLSLLFLLIAVFIVFIAYHEYYYIPKYFKTDTNSYYDSDKVFWEKVLDLRVFLGKSTIILTPTILLVIAKFYKEQQTYLKLNEQKISAELSALKHQLNPHFLFNTLNNLYALSIEKSDEAPEVIAKLSEILDYMIYGSSDKYVSLKKEIKLIENYLALEKVRYDDRVAISFEKHLETDVNIAPLILLTFIENAFKHGVSQELKKARVDIKISLRQTFIFFEISNSVAKNKVSTGKETIGLANIKKQLELLYHNNYSLDIEEKNNYFIVRLKLLAK